MRNLITSGIASVLYCVVLGCTSSKPMHQAGLDQSQSNNTVVFKGNPPASNQPHDGEATNTLIFQGKNNLLEVILNQQPSKNTSKGKGGVLIIKGNGNIIKLDSLDRVNTRMVRNAEGDTLILTGNNKKLVIKNGIIRVPKPKPKLVATLKTKPNGDTVLVAANKKTYQVKNGKVMIPKTRKNKRSKSKLKTSKSLKDQAVENQLKNLRIVKRPNGQALVTHKDDLGKTDTYRLRNGKIVQQPSPQAFEVPMTRSTFEVQGYVPDFEEQIKKNQSVYFDYFQEIKSIKEALNYFVQKIKTTNEPQYYYQLGEMYNYGIGTKILPNKAIELYKFAAAKNHLLSIRRLGDLYNFGKFSLKPNAQLARYYYARGKQLGDMYCIHMLKQ